MAKIVGLYTVGYKTTNGGARRLDLVVMENLFHGHRIAESFDLKGSMRNRLVDPSGNNVQVKSVFPESSTFSKSIFDFLIRFPLILLLDQGAHCRRT